MTSRLEEVIGHTFREPALLREALTHPSFANENPGSHDYDRLEFLGDAVLGLVVAEFLFRTLPAASESEMSRRRAAVVNGKALAQTWTAHALDGALRLGAGMASDDRQKARENALEAVIGAVFVDAGLDAARDVVLTLLRESLETAPEPVVESPKTLLQNALQARGRTPPRYELMEQSGTDHEPRFTVAAISDGVVLGEGSGPSKRVAENAAARDALSRGGAG